MSSAEIQDGDQVINQTEKEKPDRSRLKAVIIFGGALVAAVLAAEATLKGKEATADELGMRYDILLSFPQLNGSEPIRGTTLSVTDIRVETDFNGGGFQRNNEAGGWSGQNLSNPGVRDDILSNWSEERQKSDEAGGPIPPLEDTPLETRTDKDGNIVRVPTDPLKQSGVFQIRDYNPYGKHRLVIEGVQTERKTIDGEDVVTLTNKQERIELPFNAVFMGQMPPFQVPINEY